MSFMDRCACTKIYKPEYLYAFTGNCIVTGKPYTVKVPGSELFAYNRGAHIQDAMPSLSKEDREFLISGTSPEGFKKLFGDGEEDTEDS